MSKLNWANLTKEERTRYMQLQMSPSYGAGDSYLPDDCSDCGACGSPVMGAGWCINCLREFNMLDSKLRGDN